MKALKIGLGLCAVLALGVLLIGQASAMDLVGASVVASLMAPLLGVVSNRNSTLYTKLHVNKYLGKTQDEGGRAYPIPFQHTVVSGETGGASAGVRDTVNLCVLPANCMVVGLTISANDLWASAGTNGTLQLGDSGDDDRYMIASEFYTAAGQLPAENNRLAFAGQNYVPTADTIVLAEYRGANPVVGKIFKGCLWVIPGC